MTRIKEPVVNEYEKRNLFFTLLETGAFEDRDGLKTYINYCYNNGVRQTKKSKRSYQDNLKQKHHIVPQSLAKVWGLKCLSHMNYTHVRMTDECHKHAHWLLYNALNKENRKIIKYCGIENKKD